MATWIIRPIRIEGQVAYVPLTRGYEAIIDASDVSLVDRWNWRAMTDQHTTYAVTSVRCPDGRQATIRLHRLMMSAPDDMQVDHRDGNGLNNRRENLRIATHSQNQHNQRRNIANTSGFKGVSWHKRECKWLARIMINGKRRSLGYWPTPEAAHAAYVKASANLHGEFANAG